MFFAGATRAKGTDAVFREADLDGDGHITLDELMVAAAIYDHRARLRSYEILADIMAGARTEAASREPVPA